MNEILNKRPNFNNSNKTINNSACNCKLSKKIESTRRDDSKPTIKKARKTNSMFLGDDKRKTIQCDTNQRNGSNEFPFQLDCNKAKFIVKKSFFNDSYSNIKDYLKI